MSNAGGAGGAYDPAEQRRQFEAHRRRIEDGLARWIVPDPGGEPAAARLPDGRLVWTVVAELWARGRDVARAAAAGLADAEALEAVLEYFRRRGQDLIPVLSQSVPASALPAPPALPDADTLPPALQAALAASDVDHFIEKHEGPWNLYWPYHDDKPEGRPQFMAIAGRAVLLPVGRAEHAKLTVRRAVISADDGTILLELRDAWAEDYYGDEAFGGKLAICDRWPGHHFYVCHTYHEWYPVGPGAGAWGTRARGEPG